MEGNPWLVCGRGRGQKLTHSSCAVGLCTHTGGARPLVQPRGGMVWPLLGFRRSNGALLMYPAMRENGSKMPWNERQ